MHLFNYHLQKREWRRWFLRPKLQFTQNGICSHIVLYHNNYTLYHKSLRNGVFSDFEREFRLDCIFNVFYELFVLHSYMLASKTLKFTQNFIGSCNCMFTVIIALFLRETYTLYGTSRFGYAWALLRDVFAVGAFIIVKIIIGIQYKYGLHIVFFVLTGFFVYRVVAECISKCMTAIQANTAILSFPHVFPLDVMISRCLFVFYTNIQSSILVIILALLYGLDFDIINVGMFFYCIVATLFLGFAVGVLMSALAIFYPVIERIWPIIKRLGFWCSGVFFTIDRFPAKYAEPLSYNPVLQLIEGLRKSLYHGIDFTSLLNFNYVNFLILIFLTLGLLLLKLSRERLNA